MKTVTTANLDQLIPDRHPQKELFICDVADAALKDIMPQMEHPFYALSKKPDTKIRRYEHNGNWLEITPSVKGLATIYDKDLLIYCISQIMEKLKRGEKVNKRVRINSKDLLIFTNRGVGGKDYKSLSEAIDRLAGTRIKTNIVTDDEVQEDNFGLINTSSIKRKNGLNGRLLWCELELSDWVFNAIRSHEVLTLHPDYFRLRKPLERRIYEIARKHCGQQTKWSISVTLLYKKSGSRSSLRLFRQMLKNLLEYNHLPDYSIFLNKEKDTIKFINRNKMPKAKQLKSEGGFPILKPDTLKKGKHAAPRYDVYFLLQEWQAFWSESGRPTLDNPDGAFINFCKNRHKNNPLY
ncbi:MAG: replication initiator protein A [Candidatus Pacebacteria bacterium]|nr:replication initiator protein A [Candidatus Paceibacterota bacterium]